MQRARLYVPTRGYVFCETANTLARLTQRAGVPLPVYVRGNASVSDVRNRIVQDFLDTDGDVLIMCDDDIVPPDHALDAFKQHFAQPNAPQIVSGVCLIIRPGTVHLPNAFVFTKGEGWSVNMKVFGQRGLIETDGVGTGLIAIQRQVLENPHMKGPFNATYSKQGILDVGEDLTFCKRATAQGYRIAVDMNVFCEHHVDVYANAVAHAYSRQIELLLDQKEEGDGGQLAAPLSLGG